MPRDNLINSASLEFFEFIRKENMKQLIVPLVEGYREKLLGITYVNIFESLVHKYDQIQNGTEGDEASFSTQGAETPNITIANGGQQRWHGLRDADAEEEAYFNTSDGDDDDEASLPTSTATKPMSNGASPVRPLVAYPDDDEDAMDVLAASPSTPSTSQESKSPSAADNGSPRASSDRTSLLAGSPPERLGEKRRREEDDEDDMEKLAGGGVKRRNSISSVRSELSAANIDAAANGSPSPKENGSVATGPTTPTLRRRGSLKSKDGGPGPQKGISIGSISLSLRDTDAEAGS